MKTWTTVGLIILLGCAGCSSTAKKGRELARVAKDWSLVVRASQVVPVYPLSEDIRPGDIFLVQTPIKEQVKVYKKKGFLPLDQMLDRLHPAGYSEFYAHATINSNRFSTFLTVTNNQSSLPFPTISAPRASFPSYNFSIKRGGGLSLALPVQGVPVAFGASGFQSAEGTITIADAFTYGVDILSLQDQLTTWASTNRSQLAGHYVGPNSSGRTTATNYLRVVNRVYLTGKVNISLNDSSTGGVAASGGADKPVSMLNLSTNAADNYTNVIESLNVSAANAVSPGGSIKFASASSRGISLSETFPRPLVIGYLGFDVPILEGGRIGNPVPTQAILSKSPVTVTHTTVYSEDQFTRPLRDRITNWLHSDAGNGVRMREWLENRNPPVTVLPLLWANNVTTEIGELRDAISELSIP